jgi:hypothetical protein
MAKVPCQIYVYRSEVTGQIVNAWLKDFDFEAEEGVGFLTTTDDRDEAMTFDDIEDLHAYWTQQSTTRPVRPDGQPNKPFTGFTIEVRPAELGTGIPWGRKNKKRGTK